MKTKSFASIIIILLSSVIFSCKKEKVVNPAKDITGQWEWIYSWTGDPLTDTVPKTPQSTGIEEIVKYTSKYTWLKIQNEVHLDSGTFSVGQGTWSPYSGVTYVFDSIVYYKDGLEVKEIQDYYSLFGTDTLAFSRMFRGIYTKSDPTKGRSKFYKRIY